MRAHTITYVILAGFLCTACGGGGGSKDAGPGTSYPTTPSTPVTPTTTVPANTVLVTNGLDFNPASLTVPRNTTINFVIGDSVHTVYFTGTGKPADLAQTKNETVQRTFATAGSFIMLCRLHSYMYGTITVSP